LLGKVVSLRTQLVELQEDSAIEKAKMAKLSERSIEREVHLGKVEGELAEKNEALKKAQEDLTTQAEEAKKAKLDFSTMPPTHTPLGLKMSSPSLLLSILTWTSLHSRRRTASLMGNWCQGALRRTLFKLVLLCFHTHVTLNSCAFKIR